jgi:hypothetical protein
MKTVASISFLADHSLSMDVEDVRLIEASNPIEVGDGLWCCELLLRTTNGTVALQLLADSPEHLRVVETGGE